MNWKMGLLVPAVVALSACGAPNRTGSSAANSQASSQCQTGAAMLQKAVGMEANAAFDYVNQQPKSVQNMTIFAGSSEGPNRLPRGKIVLQHSTPKVTQALLTGGTVTRVYCNS